MGLTQETKNNGDPTNRYILNIRLNYNTDKVVIDTLNNVDPKALRGFIVDAITSYVNNGKPLARDYSFNEQSLMMKHVFEETLKSVLSSSNFKFQGNNENGPKSFDQDNKFDQVIADISTNFFDNLTL